MNIKKIFMLLIIGLFLSGCVNVSNLSYDDITLYFNNKSKNTNTYRAGYSFYTPSGLSIINAGTSYVILEDEYNTYYMYVDLLNYINDSEPFYEMDIEADYSQIINNGKKTGYITIKLWENEQYLIEIMYNYAKIEVMVDESLINRTLINTINILSSVNYNDDVIINLLNDDKLNYTEEEFDFFENIDDNQNNYLDYIEADTTVTDSEGEIVDTDFID